MSLGRVPEVSAQTVVDLNKARMTWTWTQGTGGPVTAFRVKCGATSGSEAILVSIPDPLARSVAVNTVVGTGKSYCRVHAANAYGESGASNEIFLDAGLVPAVPGSLLVQP